MTSHVAAFLGGVATAGVVGAAAWAHVVASQPLPVTVAQPVTLIRRVELFTPPMDKNTSNRPQPYCCSPGRCR